MTILAAVSLLAEPAKVDGKWNVLLQLETITGHPVLTLKQDGEKITGTYEGRYGPSPLEGTVKEKNIAFAVTFNAEGTQTTGVFRGTDRRRDDGRERGVRRGRERDVVRGPRQDRAEVARKRIVHPDSSRADSSRIGTQPE